MGSDSARWDIVWALSRIFFWSPLGAALINLSERLTVRPGQPWVEVTSRELVLPRLAPEFDGYRLAHISDFHLGAWLTPERLDEAIDQVSALKPDLAVMTGDYFAFDAEVYAPALAAGLRRLYAPDGIVAVLGNHDHATNARAVYQTLRAVGAVGLANNVYSLRRGAARLHLAGLDDQAFHLDCLKCLLAELPRDGAAILLAHEPDFADRAAASRRFDLQLSGHTHGGQVVLPGLRPLVLPRLGRKYPAGLYRVGRMFHYTNRGLGTAAFQLRFNCPAEITLFTLRAPQRAFDSF